MANSYVTYPGDGVQRDFAVPFPYLDRSHVILSVDGASVPFSWFSDTIVRAAAEPASGSIVGVRRSTPTETRIVEFQNGSALDDDELNLAMKQAFYIAQEAADEAEAVIIPQAEAARNAAEAARDASEEARDASESARDTAQTHAQASQTARSGSEAARDGAVSAVNAAVADALLVAQQHAEAAQDARTGAEAAQDAAEEAAAAALDGAVLYDTAQTLDNNQKTLARTNIGAQASLGFTPVRQGTGIGQSGNSVAIGWSGVGLKATVDSTDLGRIWTDQSSPGVRFDTAQSLTPAQTAQARRNLGLVVSVRDYGATGNGVTDDLAAFNAAVSALPANGGELYIPPGTYFLSGPVGIANKSVRVRGAGTKVAMLFFAAGQHGILYQTNDLSHNFTISDLSLVTLSPTQLVLGLSITFPDNQGSSWKNATVRDIVLDGSSDVASYLSGNGSQNAARWIAGIWATNVAGLTIDNAFVRGRFGTKDSVGIRLEGWTVDFKITNCVLSFHQTAIVKVGPAEGFNISGVIGLACETFVRVWANDSGTVGSGGVWSYIGNCHSGNSYRGIDIRDCPQTFITNCLLYQDGTYNDFVHIHLERCSTSKIIGNHLQGNDVNFGYNIHLIGSIWCTVQANFMWQRYFALQADSASSGAIVMGNHYDGVIALEGGGLNVNNLGV